MAKLQNRKWERFAIEIASLTPYHQAYVEAGYKNSASARFNASRLAHLPAVAARIAELQAEIKDRGVIHAAYVQTQLLPLVLANAKDLFEPVFDAAGRKVGDRLKPMSDLPRDLAAAVSKVKTDPLTGGVIEIALAGKTEAANVLLRSLGAIVEKHEHDIGGIGMRLAAALSRVGQDQRPQITSRVIDGVAGSVPDPI